jgi:transposase
LARYQLVSRESLVSQVPLVLNAAYPLVLWVPPAANSPLVSDATANGHVADQNTSSDNRDRLCALIAQLCANANYWERQAHHWKWRAGHYQRLFHDAQAKAATHVAQLQAEIDALQAIIRQHEHEARSPKSETHPNTQHRKPSTRKRGRQPGQKRPPRRDFQHLPTTEETIALPPEQRCCPQCHQPYADFPGTDDGEIIEIDVRAHRRHYHRQRYRRTCTCANRPCIVTAPPPPKVVPKGILGVSVWVYLLMGKFAQYQPLQRLLTGLRDHGLDLSAATVADGLRHILTLLQPIYDGLARHQRDQDLWQADETRWMVFVGNQRQPKHAWTLFVFRSPESIVFLLEAERTHHVPQDYLWGESGILCVDRASIYKAMQQVKDGRIILAFCWAHQRRNFLRLLVAWKDHAAVMDWAGAWLERISQLFAANNVRVSVLADPAAFAVQDRVVREQVTALAQQRDAQLQQADLHPACRKALESLQRHWEGLTVFVEHPKVPMDNNAAERSERGPVLGRKNYYGSGALWSGQLAAYMFSIVQTLQLWDLSCERWLTIYLQACAEAGGAVPAHPEAFLPWNLSTEHCQAWSLKEASGPVPPDDTS